MRFSQSSSLFWVRDVALFELQNGFYAKLTSIGDLQTPGIEDLAQILRMWMVFMIFSNKKGLRKPMFNDSFEQRTKKLEMQKHAE